MPRHPHDGARHVLVAPRDGDARVVGLRAGNGLDAVGDDLACLQAEPHSLVAHRDGVGDSDGVVLPAEHVEVSDGAFDFFGEVQEVHVARVAFPPDGGDAHVAVGG